MDSVMDLERRPHLTDADVVAPLALNHRGVVVNVQDVDGEGVIRMSGW